MRGPGIEGWVRGDLENIAEGVQQFPPQNGDSPEVIGWEEFFARHPERLTMTTGTAFALAEHDRTLIDETNIAHTFIAGAIMRRHMYDEELTKIGKVQ